MGDGAASRIARRAPAVVAACVSACMAGCVIVPTTVETYDPSCQVVVRHIELAPVQIAQINRCSNQGCTAMIVAGAATAAATAVVSGSIAIVGNVAYWVERHASCRGPEPTPRVPPSTPRIVPAPGASPIPVAVPDGAASGPAPESVPASAPG